MQGKPQRVRKKLAPKAVYVSPSQTILEGFETPFGQKLVKDNRWVILSDLLPWDKMVSKYDKVFKSEEGRPPISGRAVLGAIIIKHILCLTDRETIQQISENMYMQYFLGYSTYTPTAPFTAPLFVEIRKRLTLDIIEEINEVVTAQSLGWNKESDEEPNRQSSDGEGDNTPEETPKKGKLMMDATVAPQNITYPTDLKVLNAARRESESIIDSLHKAKEARATKPRTYRKEAKKHFVTVSMKRRKSHHEIRKACSKQLSYLSRNLRHIDKALSSKRQR